jgi:hypothetical protein
MRERQVSKLGILSESAEDLKVLARPAIETKLET